MEKKFSSQTELKFLYPEIWKRNWKCLFIHTDLDSGFVLKLIQSHNCGLNLLSAFLRNPPAALTAEMNAEELRLVHTRDKWIQQIIKSKGANWTKKMDIVSGGFKMKCLELVIEYFFFKCQGGLLPKNVCSWPLKYIFAEFKSCGPCNLREFNEKGNSRLHCKTVDTRDVPYIGPQAFHHFQSDHEKKWSLLMTVFKTIRLPKPDI